MMLSIKAKKSSPKSAAMSFSRAWVGDKEKTKWLHFESRKVIEIKSMECMRRPISTSGKPKCTAILYPSEACSIVAGNAQCNSQGGDLGDL